MASLTGFSAIADREGFVVVYPNGRNVSWNSDLDGVTSGVKFVDDSEFVLALVDELLAKYGLDETRIYVTGASNGGMMTQRLACQHPEVFAAAAPVMGSLEEANAMDCAPAVSIPILLLHGTADETVPYEGGTRDTLRAPTYLSVPENAQLWAGFNGCDPLSPRSFLLPEVVPGDGMRARYTAFRDCPDSATTAYYTLEGGGHTWPGSSQNYPETVVGPVSFEIDASEVIWDFVSQFQRTPGAG